MRSFRRSDRGSRTWAVPPALIEQLKVGGRLVMPLGPAHAPQQLTVVEKIAPSETRMRSIILVRFVPFTRSKD
jgi:protein-L-isoaspartate(D-aspartate) O-methyltransferase